MKFKTLLMHTASIAATTAAGAGVAHAQSTDPALKGYTLSVEGGLLFDNMDAIDKCGSGGCPAGVINTNTHNIGFHGAIGVRKQIDNYWDFGVGAAINGGNKTAEDLTAAKTGWVSGGSGLSGGVSGAGTYTGPGSSYYNANYSMHEGLSHSFDFQTFDLEAGYTPQLGNDVSVRLSAGLRALHYKDSVDKTGGVGITASGFSSGTPISGTAGYDKTGTGARDFWGAGPRLGVSAQKRFTDSRFGLSGMLAGAAIFGHTTSKGTVSATQYTTGYFSGSTVGPPVGSSSFSSGASKTVFDIEAAAGVDYYLDDNTTLTFGYRAEELTKATFSASSDKANYLSHGPFLKLVSHY